MPLSNAERSRRRYERMTPQQRTRARLFYAKRRRTRLVLAIAPDCRCARCRKKFDPADLMIDHVNGRTWLVEKHSPWARVARYWREWEAGVQLRVKCRSCSALDGGRGGNRYELDAEGNRVRRVAARGDA